MTTPVLEAARQGIELHEEATAFAFSPKALMEVRGDLLAYHEHATREFPDLARAYIKAVEALEAILACEENALGRLCDGTEFDDDNLNGAAVQSQALTDALHLARSALPTGAMEDKG